MPKGPPATLWSVASRLAPPAGVVLLYHAVPREAGGVSESAFEVHVRFLKRHFEIIRPGDTAQTQSTGKLPVAITFDDGFRNNAEVAAPILRRHGVPALFFVSSRHCAPGQYLWFVYLRALQRYFSGNGFRFQGEFWDMSAARRADSLQRLRSVLLGVRPHPEALYAAIEAELPRLEDFVPAQAIADAYAGMTAEQVGELANDSLFEIGGHTVDHPMLPLCDAGETARQVLANREWVERVTGRPCRFFAYPSGEYDLDVISACRRLGYRTGYCVESRFLGDPAMEIPRVGIYSASPHRAGLKIVAATALRRFGMRIS